MCCCRVVWWTGARDEDGFAEHPVQNRVTVFKIVSLQKKLIFNYDCSGSRPDRLKPRRTRRHSGLYGSTSAERARRSRCHPSATRPRSVRFRFASFASASNSSFFRFAFRFDMDRCAASRSAGLNSCQFAMRLILPSLPSTIGPSVSSCCCARADNSLSSARMHRSTQQ